MVFSSMRRTAASAGASSTQTSAMLARVNDASAARLCLCSARIAAQIRSRGVSLPAACRWMGLRAIDPPHRRFAGIEWAVAPDLEACRLRARRLRVLARALDVHADAPRDAARLLHDLGEQL